MNSESGLSLKHEGTVLTIENHFAQLQVKTEASHFLDVTSYVMIIFILRMNAIKN